MMFSYTRPLVTAKNHIKNGEIRQIDLARTIHVVASAGTFCLRSRWAGHAILKRRQIQQTRYAILIAVPGRNLKPESAGEGESATRE